MYLTQVRLENIKCFADITLDFKASRDDEATRQQNWNVILGDNAAGKTTLLQAIAACLIDTTSFNGMVQFQNWTRQDEGYGRLTLKLQGEAMDGYPDSFTPPPDNAYAIQHIIVPPFGFTPDAKRVFISRGSRNGPPIKGRHHLERTEWIDKTRNNDVLSNMKDDSSSLFDPKVVDMFQLLNDTLFNIHNRQGWIRCGYGALRRARGSTTQGINIQDNSIEEQFMTLFIEETALYKGENWLKDLERFAFKYKKYSIEGKNFDTVKQTIIDILPEVEDLILDDRLRFVQKGQKYTLDELSDGYRAMFVLAIDILRWLDLMNADPNIPLNQAAGVVLIDEIDAHLHPKWQRKIGFELTRIFPNIQFIVTTHSPYIAMAAGEGALTVLEKGDDAVIANQNIPLVRDWTVDRILNDLFHESEYSVVVEQDLKEYDKLQAKKQRGEMTEMELQDLIKLTDDLNRRLADDENSPKQQTLEKYLAELDNLLEAEAA